MKKTLNTIESESSKWFRRFMGVVAATVVTSVFLLGFVFILGACISGTYYSIILLILGVAMIYYSSKGIDTVLIKLGYRKDLSVTKEKSIKKRK
tara:strand:+ start:103 stop:384 length:282 start_codon:yes stop_codon:yes gene_type:complete